MKYFTFSLFIIFSSFCFCEKSEIASRLELIKSKEDFYQVEGLFKYLFFDELFAFTLFGCKPMSTIAVYKPSRAMDRVLFNNSLNYSLESLWKVWEKYKDIFPSSNFVFFNQDQGDFFEICLVNKKKCLEVIEENLSIFQQEIGLKKTPKEILDSLCDRKDIFSGALNKSQILYGILFGYGKENAKGFYNLHCHPHRFIMKQPDRIEHDWLTTSFCILEIPRFASFSEEEGGSLIKKYDAERTKILDEYSKGDFLEITLKKLCEPLY